MRGKKKPRTKDPAAYRKRTYRQFIDHAGLISFQVRIRETDLHVMADADLTGQVFDLVLRYRSQLENYIAKNPEFLSALTPLPPDPLAPAIVKSMLQAGEAAKVGPMAAVAGALAEFVGKDLLAAETSEIIIENGGDIFLNRRKDCTIGIFAGASPLSNRLGIIIPAARMPMGICTSSGTVGHSLSYGKADAATVLAPSTSLADAVATRVGNEIKKSGDIDQALALAQTIPGVSGVLVIHEEQLGAWGEVELVSLS